MAAANWSGGRGREREGEAGLMNLDLHHGKAFARLHAVDARVERRDGERGHGAVSGGEHVGRRRPAPRRFLRDWLDAKVAGAGDASARCE
jgi:hypothetical protein